MKHLFVIIFSLMTLVALKAQSPNDIVKIEYGFDEFPAIGRGNSLTVQSPNTTVSFTTQIPLGQLRAGIHTLYFRTMNRAGKWSLTNETSIMVSDLSLPKIKKLAYSFDTYALGTSVTELNWPESGKFSLPLSQLSPGLHILYTKAMDEAERWSHLNEQIFYIPKSKTHIKGFTYYFSGSNYTSATYTILVNPASANVSTLLHTEPGLLEIGKEYVLTLSAIDAEGRKSHPQTLGFKYQGIATGTGATTGNNIVFFPNPASTVINVKHDGMGQLRYKLFDMHGKICQQGIVTNGQINVERVPKGKYLIVFDNETIQATSNLIIN